MRRAGRRSRLGRARDRRWTSVGGYEPRAWAMGTPVERRDGERCVRYREAPPDAPTRSATAARYPGPTLESGASGHHAPSDGQISAPCYRAGVVATLTDRGSALPADGARGAPLEARWLGRIDYREAHSLQKRLVDERATDRIGDQLLLLEHPPVLTLGKRSDPAPYPGDARGAGAARDRHRAHRARWRGHLPRARPARRLSDPAASRARAVAPAVRPGARGGPRRDVCRPRRRRRAARRPSGLLVRPRWRRAAEDRRPGPACRARRQLPRDRAQRDRRSRRLRADRRRAGCPASCRPRSRASSATRCAARRPTRSSAPPGSSRGRSRPRSTPRLSVTS